jgi:zinc protease
VRNEFEIGENDPQSVLSERVWSAAYLWHNYGNSVIGSREDIERVKADRLRLFYQKYYQPDNATLIIGGKFDEKFALDAIAKYFGPLARPTRVLEKTYTVEPAQDGERYVELRRNGDEQIAMAAYHTVSYADADMPAIDCLIDILTEDPSGIIYKVLVEPQIAAWVYGYQPNLRDPALTTFGMQVSKEKDFETAKKLFLEELDKIPDNEYTQAEVDRMITRHKKSWDNYINNTIGRASMLTNIISAGDYRLDLLYRDAFEKLTVDDIKRVAKKYFMPNNRTIGVFIPSQNEERVKPVEISDEQLAEMTVNYKGREMTEEIREFAPTIANLKANLTTGTLPNSMQYGVIRKPVKGNKVSANFTFRVGNLEALSNGKSDAASFMGRLITSGCKTMDKQAIQDRLDQIKTSINFGCNGQNFTVSINTFEENLQEAFALTRTLLTEATFPENEFTKLAEQWKTAYESNKQEPQAVASLELRKKLNPYPKGHPFYTETIDEMLEKLKTVKLEDIKELYSTLIGTSDGYGVVLGDVDPATIEKLLNETFGDLKASIKYEKIPELFPETKPESLLIKIADKENGVLFGASTFHLDRNSPDYPALIMANEILGSGGFLSARIPSRLREKEGISYGAGSSLSVPIETDFSQLFVFAMFNPTKQKEVDAAMNEEILNAVEKGFTQTELETTLKGFLNERELGLGSDGTLMSLVNQYLRYGIPLERYDELTNKVKALKVEEVNAATKKYIDPKKFIMIFAGDFNKQ